MIRPCQSTRTIPRYSYSENTAMKLKTQLKKKYIHPPSNLALLKREMCKDRRLELTYRQYLHKPSLSDLRIVNRSRCLYNHVLSLVGKGVPTSPSAKDQPKSWFNLPHSLS